MARAISTASSCLALGTSMRVGALQDWPELPMQPKTPPDTAFLRSASSSTMLADLPPNSWATRLTLGAAAWATWMPARVEPVNDTMSMPGWPEMAAPTVSPLPLTTLKTPAGRPAASRISVNSMALKGATSLGLSTMVQPAASAGATLMAIWLTGQFQGVMKPQTPMGSLRTRVVPRFSSNS